MCVGGVGAPNTRLVLQGQTYLWGSRCSPGWMCSGFWCRAGWSRALPWCPIPCSLSLNCSACHLVVPLIPCSPLQPHLPEFVSHLVSLVLSWCVPTALGHRDQNWHCVQVPEWWFPGAFSSEYYFSGQLSDSWKTGAIYSLSNPPYVLEDRRYSITLSTVSPDSSVHRFILCTHALPPVR